MSRNARIAAVLAVSVVTVAGVAYAADEATTPPKETPAQATADRDVGKLSADGMQAFRDLHQTRVAIFDADPSAAKADIAKAQSELAKAKADNTVFMKAEADLTPPKQAGKAATPPAMGADAKTPVAWLPIDGQLALADDFVATPTKSAAVSDANKALEKGDRKAAVDRLKLADVNVSFTLAVAPLGKTTTAVDQAASLINEGKFYEANAALKQAEDGIRFDVVNMNGVPKAQAANANATTATTPPAAEPAAKPAK